MFRHDSQKIRLILKDQNKADEKEIDRILDKARNLEELSLEEAFALIKTEGATNLTSKIFSAAKEIRDRVIGKVVYLPVPLYVSNFCSNDCLYCSYRRSNKIPRKRLDEQGLIKEVKALVSDGFNIIELVFGEDAFFTPERIARYVSIAKRELGGLGEIVLNIAPIDDTGFKLIQNAGIDRLVQWQETYDLERYALLHNSGNKSDFTFRVEAYERMLDTGIKNIGMGVLFGLSDYRYDVLSLIQHANYIKNKYKISPIIGIPRLKAAHGTLYEAGEFEVTDEQLKLAVAVYRLALPYSSIFLSTREKLDLLLDLLDCGGGTLLATKCSVKVGYGPDGNNSIGQFDVYSFEPKEVNKILTKKGFTPSFNRPLYNLV